MTLTITGEFFLPMLTGALVAVFAVVLSEYVQTRHFSKLQFGEVELHRQFVPILDDYRLPVYDDDGNEMTIESYVWRLRVSNVGRYPAYDVTTELAKIYDEGQLRPDVVVAPMNWMHNPPGSFLRDIFGSQSAYLDICQWTRYAIDIPMLSNTPVSGIAQSNELRSGETTLLIRFFQRSGQRIDVEIAIQLDRADPSMTVARLVKTTRLPTPSWRIGKGMN